MSDTPAFNLRETLADLASTARADGAATQGGTRRRCRARVKLLLGMILSAFEVVQRERDEAMRQLDCFCRCGGVDPEKLRERKGHREDCPFYDQERGE